MFDKKSYLKNWKQQNKDRVKIHDRKYQQSEKGKLARKRFYEKYKKSEKNKKRYQRYRKTEKCRLTQKRWRQSKKGKINMKKRKALRERNFGWTPVFKNPFDKIEKIEWHHINNNEVVALPKDLHQLYKDKNHRENLLPIINQIYMESG